MPPRRRELPGAMCLTPAMAQAQQAALQNLVLATPGPASAVPLIASERQPVHGHVLLVEDTVVNRLMASAMLTELGLEVRPPRQTLHLNQLHTSLVPWLSVRSNTPQVH